MATAAAAVSEREHRELPLSGEDRWWERWDGAPVEKPPTSVQHNGPSTSLAALINQLDWRAHPDAHGVSIDLHELLDR